MKKRILSLLLVAALMCAMLPQLTLPAWADDYSGSCGDKLTWSFDPDSGTLTIEGSGAMTAFDYDSDDIPWYSYSSEITAVSLPNGLTTIGDYAFCECSSLEDVHIPDGVTLIGTSAFFACSGLTSVSIPNSVKKISDSAFEECSALTAVTIPSSVTRIGGYAFYFCSALKEVSIPGSVKSVGECAFLDCHAMTSVRVSDSVTNIGNMAFGWYRNTEKNCYDRLTGFTIYGYTGSATQSYAEQNAFPFVSLGEASQPSDPNSGSCGDKLSWRFDPDSGTLTIEGSGDMLDFDNDTVPWASNGSDITTVVLPTGLTGIGDYAFTVCSGLTSVAIPGSVTRIGRNAFAYCGSLTSVNIPNAVTEIGDEAFEGCGSLTSVSIPATVTSLGSAAFAYCNSLKRAAIQGGVTALSDELFYYCDALTSVSLPQGVTCIGDKAFYGCSALPSVSLPTSVTSIGDNAFYGCSSLTSMNIPANVASIGSDVFLDCDALQSIQVASGNASFSSDAGVLFNKARTALIFYPAGKAGSAYSIPNGVTSIGCNAFRNCNDLTSVTIANSVKTVGSNAFYNCSGLGSVSIPASVTTIEAKAFGWHLNRTSYTIEIVEGFKIYGYKETAAQSYANANNIPFVDLNAIPVITGQPKSASVESGAYVSFGVTATGENLHYQWQYKKANETTWSDWSGKTTASIKFKGVDSNNGNQYRCVVSNAFASVTSNAATLTVTGLKPVITAQPASASVAKGAYVTFSVTASGSNLHYQWQYKKANESTWKDWSGVTTASIKFKGVDANNGNQYRCVVSNASGSVTSNAATLTVTGLKPVITAQPASASVAKGAYVTFSVTASGSNLHYQWQYKKANESTWKDWSGVTTASIKFKGVDANNGNQYRCVVSNASGSVTSNAATLTVTGLKPVITAQPASASVENGAYVSFTVTATGSNLHYQWQYKKTNESSWSDWSGKTTASIRFKGVATNNGNQYRCVVSNASGSVTSNAATLSVTGCKPVIITQPVSASVEKGTYVSFSVTASGSNLRYQWQYKKANESTWSDWSGKTTASIRFKAVDASNGNQYRCVVTNDEGSVTSNAATLTVTNPE